MKETILSYTAMDVYGSQMKDASDKGRAIRGAYITPPPGARWQECNQNAALRHSRVTSPRHARDVTLSVLNAEASHAPCQAAFTKLPLTL